MRPFASATPGAAPPASFVIVLCVFVFLFAPRQGRAQVAADQADDGAYPAGTWPDGSNGGTGFDVWTLIVEASPAALFKASSTTNGDGDTGGDGDIDTSGEAWVLSAQGPSGFAAAIRPFAGPLQVNETFSLQMDNGLVESGAGQFVGFQLQNDAGELLFDFSFSGGNTFYAIVDGSGTFFTTIPFTDEGLEVALTLTGASTYSVTLTPLDGALSPQVIASSLPTPAGGTAMTRVLLLNDRSGPGPAHDVFFNRLQITSPILPVELVSFEARRDGEAVVLTWATASETNNAGFEVEHRGADEAANEPDWETLGFVEGAGTASGRHNYDFRVEKLPPGAHRFRLRQLDFDGSFAFSPEVEVTVEVATAYVLSAAYPNPFNPRATFTLAVREAQPVQVVVFDMLGRRMALLHDGMMAANRVHTFALDGAGWASGTYLYRVTGATFSVIRTVVLVR